MPLALAWIRPAKSSASGDSVSTLTDCLASKITRAVADQRANGSPRRDGNSHANALISTMTVGGKTRWSLAELRREAVAQGLVAQISGTTLWRWLSHDALRPWRHRCWIFPRDPAFAIKAGRILDLYQRRWENKALGPRDYVLCADEKTSIQARRRKHPSLPPGPGRPIYVEHEYARTGAWAYIAAWDVHRAKLFGRCERKTGIVPFDRLVAQVMRQQPYRSARRVFWIVDNGSSHRGQRAAARLRAKWPNIILVHTPVHASWLNQIEVYFSIVQRKLLTPNDFANLAALRDQLMRFQQRYQQSAKPFEWTFARSDLDVLLEKLKQKPNRLAA
jgi:hypothetical protein